MKEYTKFAHRDPHPYVPFAEARFPKLTKAEAFLYACACCFAVGALVLLEWSK